MGPRAGAKSLHQAWEAYLLKKSVEEYAKDHPELNSAIEYFGKPVESEFRLPGSTIRKLDGGLKEVNR